MKLRHIKYLGVTTPLWCFSLESFSISYYLP